MRRLLAPLTATTLLVAATPAVASWAPAKAQTRSGVAREVHVAGGPGDRIAVGYSRLLSGSFRAEVRLGRARTGLTASPLGLDKATSAVEAPQPQYIRGGAFAAAWLRYDPGHQVERLRLRMIDAKGKLGSTDQLTGPSQYAFEPQWVPGPVPSLLWSRETRSDAIEFATTGFRNAFPPAPAHSEPAATSNATGLASESWVRDGKVLVADRTATGFGPATTVATGEVNLTQVVRTRSGATLVFWRQDNSDLMVAARPAGGGAFGPAQLVMASTTDAATAVETTAGEVLVTSLVGDSSRVGQVTLARLSDGGSLLGPLIPLGRGRTVQLSASGTGSAFVGYLSGDDAARTVTVRRIAPGGIVGTPKVLAKGVTTRPAVAATREGGAVAAWIRDGRVEASTYRP